MASTSSSPRPLSAPPPASVRTGGCGLASQTRIRTELEQAAELYAAGPGPAEDHGFGMEALAHIDLAVARFRTDNLDATAIALAPVLSLPTGKRIKNLPQRLGRVRAELAGPRYQGSAQARELDEHIEEFTRDTIVAGLHELPG